MSTWPVGVGREHLAEVDSTNAEALRRAARGETGPVWLLAARQMAARGRRGRAWASPPGNFAATLLMPMPDPPAVAAQRSFVAALALLDALAMVGGGGVPRYALKWPNDVLLDGRKVAGILLETGPAALAIGFGVNLAAAPDPALLDPGAVTPISLREAMGVTVEPAELLDVLGPFFERWDGRLREHGFGTIRANWLGKAARLGEPIVARLPGRMLEGRFETIDETGALVLATDAGPVVLPAADVHFPETADAARD